jgi:putative transposase
MGCEVTEMNIQNDHVHMVAMIPPKLAVPDVMGRLKGQTAMKLFRLFRQMRKIPYWGNHFWSIGYCVDTVGLDPEMDRKYVEYQEKRERIADQLNLDLQDERRWHNSGGRPPWGQGLGPPMKGLKQIRILRARILLMALKERAVTPAYIRTPPAFQIFSPTVERFEDQTGRGFSMILSIP